VPIGAGIGMALAGLCGLGQAAQPVSGSLARSRRPRHPASVFGRVHQSFSLFTMVIFAKVGSRDP
jgi:hypothetical protein